jgi:hypothetical protein
MLATRVMHASAKGRRRQFRSRQAIAGVCEGRRENLATQCCSKMALLDPAATDSIGDTSVMIWGGHPPTCGEESNGIYGS